MIRRPGFVVATVFALGAMLGLVTSSVFLSVDAHEIRAATGTRASAQAGPIAGLLMANLEDQDVFGRIADDIRADQIRNLMVGAAVAAVAAVGLGVVFSRRALAALTRTDRRRPNRNITADRDPPR
jgi:hypothetical protein